MRQDEQIGLDEGSPDLGVKSPVFNQLKSLKLLSIISYTKIIKITFSVKRAKKKKTHFLKHKRFLVAVKETRSILHNDCLWARNKVE